MKTRKIRNKVTPWLTSEIKNGDKSDCNSYRPILVLSIIAKVFEKLVYNQLISYIDKNKILSDSQFGFRKRHSTSTSLLNATNNWLLNIDKGLIKGVLFLDLRKEFDAVYIYQWLVSNGLTLNLTKTEYMIIGSRDRLKKIELNPEIKIGGQSVKRVKTTKCLDDKLRWEGHIDQVSKIVKRSQGA